MLKKNVQIELLRLPDWHMSYVLVVRDRYNIVVVTGAPQE